MHSGASRVMRYNSNDSATVEPHIKYTIYLYVLIYFFCSNLGNSIKSQKIIKILLKEKIVKNIIFVSCGRVCSKISKKNFVKNEFILQKSESINHLSTSEEGYVLHSTESYFVERNVVFPYFSNFLRYIFELLYKKLKVQYDFLLWINI